MQKTGIQSLGQEDPLEKGIFQNFCLETLMDRGAWWATVHRVAKGLDIAEQLTHLTQSRESTSKVIVVKATAL